ncbi:hypothetical protein ACWGB8_07905 [Kitasatospora sp. NPDC054939]
MNAALLWAVPAALALTVLAAVHPHGPTVTLRTACGIWAALTLLALPLILR